MLPPVLRCHALTHMPFLNRHTCKIRGARIEPMPQTWTEPIAPIAQGDASTRTPVPSLPCRSQSAPRYTPLPLPLPFPLPIPKQTSQPSQPPLLTHHLTNRAKLLASLYRYTMPPSSRHPILPPPLKTPAHLRPQTPLIRSTRMTHLHDPHLC